MAMANVAGDGFEFLSDPIDRFPLPDLAAAEFFLRGEANQSLGCAVAQSSNGAVWDGAVIAQEEFESGSKRIATSNSERWTARAMDKRLTQPTGFACRTSPPVNHCWMAKQCKLWYAQTLNPALVMWVMVRQQYKEMSIAPAVGWPCPCQPQNNRQAKTILKHLAGSREYVWDMHLLNVHHVLAGSVPSKKHCKDMQRRRLTQSWFQQQVSTLIHLEKRMIATISIPRRLDLE
ncbi:uncharacterized protein [Aegilops tauschii subsp. strangulata]|uniref:uncharacterized protein isoform X2 n=1 Tax=Aegilops tauschii subsp. strangulata TaxID=200361 RepID=UPI000989ACC4|nr:uncharacterized protein LOC109734801 isoform X2 [Aegilops tauschii subsp. strangulata]